MAGRKISSTRACEPISAFRPKGIRRTLAIPAWTEHPSRFLKQPYFPTPLEKLKPMLVAQSPLAFRRRMIFVEHEPLRRARMPVSETAR